MATAVRSIAPAGDAPGNIIEKSASPTRRGVLGAVAAIGAAAIPTAGLASPLPSTGAWDAALARYRAAEAEHLAMLKLEDDVQQRLWDYLKTIRPTGLIEFGWAPVSYQIETMDLDSFPGLYNWPHVDPHAYDGNAIESAVRHYRAIRDDAEQSSGMAAAEQAAGAACDRDGEAFDALMKTRVPNMAALTTKLELLRERTDADRFIDELIHDVRAIG